MSIEQKIAKLLAESKEAQIEEQLSEDLVEDELDEEALKAPSAAQNPDNARNDVEDEKSAEGGTSKKANKVTANASAQDAKPTVKEELSVDVSADVAALINGEELSEEFKTKAATIFEAAVVSRVKQEVAKLEEAFEAKLDEQLAQNIEGIVEQVDGYLGYIAEQWMAQNELALERGMKAEILEGFVAGLKGLFEEHYIEVPEEKFDVLGSLEEQIEQLSAKLDEQVAANVELTKTVSEMTRNEIVTMACEGLAATEVEKLKGLAEELVFEDSESFKGKVQTIRENYFVAKPAAEVSSVVSDAPVEALFEEKKVDPTMAKYLQALNRK
jgi:SHS2 domain-containing protein